MTLLEQLQQRLANLKPTQTLAPQQQQLTQQLQSGTGKATTSGSPMQSSLGEQAMLAQGQTQLKQQQQQGALAAEQLGQQTQEITQREQLHTEQLQSQQRQAEADMQAKERVTQADLATQEELATERREAERYMRLNELAQRYDNAVKRLATERGITEDKLFSNYTREQAKLQLDKAGSQLHQELFALTLANRKYIAEIEDIGARKRLHQASEFQQEVQRLTYGNAMARTLAEYGFLRQVDADARTYKRILADLDIESMVQLFNTVAAGNRDAAYIGAVGTAASVAGGVMKAKPKSEDKTKT